jgi:GST-like protein
MVHSISITQSLAAKARGFIMLNLYSWDTSNGRKIAIMLEELGLDYRYHPIDISQGEQHSDKFLAINPNGKIPVIIDPDGPEGKPITIFESGAILIYLAEKYNSSLLPQQPQERMQVLQWLMFQMGSIGPMFGQALHFYKYADEVVPYATDRYMKEALRLYGVMNDWLENRDYFAAHYSIADIAIYPWIARWQWLDIDWNKFPNLKAWYDRLSERPAIQKGLSALAQ